MLGPSQGMKGLMHDETSDNFMTPAELKTALTDAEKATGKKVDVLAFDASNATQVEMLYELKDSVKYVVGSEGLVSGAGMSVPSVVYELKKSNIDRARTPEEVAQTFTMVGSTLQLPGVGGGSQVASFLAYTVVFGVEKEPAAAASAAPWLVAFAASSLAGVPLLIQEGFSMAELRRIAREEEEAAEAGAATAPVNQGDPSR